jgi:hypothetical protein
MKLTAAQKETLTAYKDHQNKGFKGQGEIKPILGRLPHPNTLDKLVSLGMLEKAPGYYAHK